MHLADVRAHVASPLGRLALALHVADASVQSARSMSARQTSTLSAVTRKLRRRLGGGNLGAIEGDALVLDA